MSALSRIGPINFRSRIGAVMPQPVLAIEPVQPVVKSFEVNQSTRQEQRVVGFASKHLRMLMWARDLATKPLALRAIGRGKTRAIKLQDPDQERGDDALPSAQISAKEGSHNPSSNQDTLLPKSSAGATELANASAKNGPATAALPDQQEATHQSANTSAAAPLRTASQPAEAQAARLFSGCKKLKTRARIVPNTALVDGVANKLPAYAASAFREQFASLSALRPLVSAAA
jgi:hypothetical protein